MLQNALTLSTSALAKHQAEQQLQRNGMYRLRDEERGKDGVAMLHLDAKSKYFYPRMWHDLRSLGNDKYWCHALGKLPFLTYVSCVARIMGFVLRFFFFGAFVRLPRYDEGHINYLPPGGICWHPGHQLDWVDPFPLLAPLCSGGYKGADPSSGQLQVSHCCVLVCLLS